MGGDDGEALLREVLQQLSKLDARVEALAEGQRATQEDAREARDLGNRVATILEEQNIVARLGEQRVELRQMVQDLREDVVAANTRLKNEMDALSTRLNARCEALEKRVEPLEAERNKVVGVASFFSWLSRVAPWLLAGIAAFAAGLGLKD